MWQVAWAHPMYGNILASCSYDRKVIIWKEENGTWDKMYEYTGHDSSGKSLTNSIHILRHFADVLIQSDILYSEFIQFGIYGLNIFNDLIENVQMEFFKPGAWDPLGMQRV